MTEAPSSTVAPGRVEECVKYKGPASGYQRVGLFALRLSVAATKTRRFWVRQDAISDEIDQIDTKTLRSVDQSDGVAYARVSETFGS